MKNTIPELTPEDLTRFYPKIKKTNNCWIWLGSKNSVGYGQFDINKKKYLTHRISFQTNGGILDHTLELDHLCHNPLCVNPEHLEQVTHQEINQRGDLFNRKKKHCPKGHLYDEITSQGHRGCSICRVKYMREYMRIYNK